MSRYTRETLISSPQQRAFPGIYFLYSMEPETLVKKTDAKNDSSLLTFISVFGSLYTLLSTLFNSSHPQLSCSIAVPIRKVSINWIRLFVTNTSLSFPKTCHTEVFVVCLVKLRRRLHTPVKNPTSPFQGYTPIKSKRSASVFSISRRSTGSSQRRMISAPPTSSLCSIYA